MNDISLSWFVASGILCAIFFALGWYMREIVYNAVKSAIPERKVRRKRVPATPAPPPPPDPATDTGKTIKESGKVD